MKSRYSFGTIKRFAIRVIALALALALPAIGALASFKANVYTSSMKVYSYPSASSKYYLGSLREGTEITVTAYRGNWAKIKYKGKTGYALISCMASQNRSKAYTAKSTPVYRSASSSSKKLGTLGKGEIVYITGKSGSYYLVENYSGSASGYIYKSNLSSKPVAKPVVKTASASSGVVKSSGSSKVDYVINVAQDLMGTPYSSSPSEPRSFDCSRFVKYCFGKAGVSLPGGSKEQGYDSSHTRIDSISDLKRGDIVCFNTNDSDDDLCDHTGIYIGGGYFVHASSSAGEVIVSSLSSGYYERTFSWGLRVFD